MNLVTQHINQIDPWLILFFAIICGSFGTTCLKLSNGFRKFWAVIGVGIGYGFSFTSLTLVLNRIDIGIGYAIWSGLSTILIVLIGVFFFKESINFKKVMSLLLIILGIVGLQISSNHEPETASDKTELTNAAEALSIENHPNTAQNPDTFEQTTESQDSE